MPINRLSFTGLSLALACSYSTDLLAQTSREGPFGLSRGMTLQQLRTTTTMKPLPTDVTGMWFTTERVPVPHSAFESYMVLVSPSVGLCKIVAIGKDIAGDSQGYQVTRAFERIDEALQAKYGTRKTYDFLHAGSIWDDPEDWMMALLKKERTLAAYWDAEEKSLLPPYLKAVTLSAKATSPSIAYLSLTYEFTNVAICLDEVTRKSNSAL